MFRASIRYGTCCNALRSGTWMHRLADVITISENEPFRILATVRSLNIHQRTPIISPSSVASWVVRISIRNGSSLPVNCVKRYSHCLNKILFEQRRPCLLIRIYIKERDAAEKFIDSLTIRFDEQIAIITNERAAMKIFTLWDMSFVSN